MADGNPITSQDFFDDQGHLDKLLGKLQANHKEINEIIVSAEKLQQLVAKLNPISNSGDRDKLRAALSEIEQLKQAQEALQKAQSQTREEIDKTKVATQKQNRENKLNAQLASAQATSYDKLTASLSLNLIKLKALTEEQVKNTKEGRELARTVKAQRDELKRLDAQYGTSVRNVGNYQSALGGVTASVKNLLLTYLSLSGAQQLVGKIFGETKALDSLDVALKLTTGSAQKAAEAKAFLSDMTERLGIGLLDTTKSYLKFNIASTAAGLNQEKTNSIFESFAKVGSTLGLRADELDGIFKALEQTLSKGTVQAEEIRGQLGDRLPGAFNILATSMGITTKELGEQLKAGKVLAKDVLPEFAKQAEIAYGVENTKRVDNLAAAQGRFARSVTLLIEKLDASGGFKTFFNTLTDIFTVIGNNLNTIFALGKAVFYLVSAWLAWKAVLIVTNALMTFSFAATVREITVKNLLAAATLRLSAAQKVLNAAIKANPIGLALTAVVALVGAMDLLINKFNAAKTAQLTLAKATTAATEEVEVQRPALNKITKEYESLEKKLKTYKKGTDEYNTTLGEMNKLLKTFNTLAPNTLASLNAEEVATVNLTLASDNYLKSLENRIKAEIINEKLNEAIRERVQLVEKLKTASFGIGEVGAGVFDDIFGTTFSASGAKKKVKELTVLIDDLGAKYTELAGSTGGAPVVEEVITPGDLTDEEFNKIIARRRKLNSFLNDGRKKELESLQIDFDVEKREAAKLGISINTLTESFRKQRLEINQKYDQQERASVNDQKFEGVDKDLEALQIALDKELAMFEKLGLDTTALEQKYRDKKTDILNKYIDERDALQIAANQRELASANEIFTNQQKAQEAKFNEVKRSEEEIAQFKLIQEIDSINHILQLREKGLIYLNDKEIKLIQSQIIEKLRLIEESEQAGALKKLEVQQEAEEAAFNTKKRTELELQRFKIEQEIKYWQSVLKITKDISPERAQIIKDSITSLQNQLGDLPKKEVNDIFSLLGISFNKDADKQAVIDSFAFAKEQMQEYFALKAELIEQDVQRSNQRVDEAQRALQAELTAEKDGHASRVDTARKDLALAKKSQQEAIKQQIAFQKSQIAINTALEASNMVLAISRIFAEVSFPLSLAAVAVMLGAFTASKIKAFQLAGKQQFGEGGLEIIGGGKHGSGNDTELPFTTKKGKRPFVEQGEAVGIINARSTSKYMHDLPTIMDSLNRGNFFDIFAKRDDIGAPVNILNVDTKRMEGSLDTIVRNTKNSEYLDKQGNKVVVQGNNRIKYLN